MKYFLYIFILALMFSCGKDENFSNPLKNTKWLISSHEEKQTFEFSNEKYTSSNKEKNYNYAIAHIKNNFHLLSFIKDAKIKHIIIKIENETFSEYGHHLNENNNKIKDYTNCLKTKGTCKLSLSALTCLSFRLEGLKSPLTIAKKINAN